MFVDERWDGAAYLGVGLAWWRGRWADEDDDEEKDGDCYDERFENLHW